MCLKSGRHILSCQKMEISSNLALILRLLDANGWASLVHIKAAFHKTPS